MKNKMAWRLLRFENGEEKQIGILHHPDGADVMGDDMDEWMREEGHYGNHRPEDYDWDGDSESVAIMARRDGMPDFRFEWVEI